MENRDMEKVRIILALSPCVLRQSLADLIERGHVMEVSCPTANPLDVLLVVRSNRAHVAIIALPAGGEMPGICSHLLAEHPDLAVVAVSEQADQFVLYR